MENPYAPPQTAGSVENPELTSIELEGPPVRFSGRVTKRDIARTLSISGGGRFLIAVLAFFTFSFGVFALIEGGEIRIGVAGLGVSISMVIFCVRRSGWGRARRYLRGSPRVLELSQGEITATTIRSHSVHGWSELHWDGIYGIDLQHDRITLALNPQHLAFVFLPKHLFDDADWARLFNACTLAAQSRPFVPAPGLANSTKLATGHLPELDNVDEAAILLEGSVTTRDLLNSPLGRKLFFKSIVTVVLVCAAVTVLLWVIGAFDAAGYYLWFLALLPALWIYRLSRWFKSAHQQESPVVLKIRAAVTESCLYVVTTRARSITYWSTFSDVMVGDSILFLRETPHSPNVIPLPRSALVNPQQWDQLVELVRRKVAEDESVSAIDAKLVEQTA